MEEYKIKNATVRIQGNYDSDKLKEVTISFLKKAEAQRKKASKPLKRMEEIHNV